MEINIEFTWHPEKAKTNLRKHGISFDTGTLVFDDPHVVIIEDCEVDGEQRYHAIGFADGQLLLLVYIDRSDGEREILHIISTRRADAYEQGAYADQFT